VKSIRIGRDFWLAAILLAASLFFVAHLHLRESGTAVFGVSSRSLPMAMAIMMSVFAATLLLGALVRGDANATGSGRTDLRRIALLLLSSLIYVAAMAWIGYFIASAVFVGWIAWLFGERRPYVIATVAILAPFALQLFFEDFMVIPLPEWRLGG
jgi:putative tricarboxylic transport membrane protein